MYETYDRDGKNGLNYFNVYNAPYQGLKYK